MKNKKQRGGKRPGAGRRQKTEGVQRVDLHTTIHPDTLKKIDANCKEKNISRGESIDNFLK